MGNKEENKKTLTNQDTLKTNLSDAYRRLPRGVKRFVLYAAAVGVGIPAILYLGGCAPAATIRAVEHRSPTPSAVPSETYASGARGTVTPAVIIDKQRLVTPNHEFETAVSDGLRTAVVDTSTSNAVEPAPPQITATNTLTSTLPVEATTPASSVDSNAGTYTTAEILEQQAQQKNRQAVISTVEATKPPDSATDSAKATDAPSATASSTLVPTDAASATAPATATDVVNSQLQAEINNLLPGTNLSVLSGSVDSKIQYLANKFYLAMANYQFGSYWTMDQIKQNVASGKLILMGTLDGKCLTAASTDSNGPALWLWGNTHDSAYPIPKLPFNDLNLICNPGSGGRFNLGYYKPDGTLFATLSGDFLWNSNLLFNFDNMTLQEKEDVEGFIVDNIQISNKSQTNLGTGYPTVLRSDLKQLYHDLLRANIPTPNDIGMANYFPSGAPFPSINGYLTDLNRIGEIDIVDGSTNYGAGYRTLGGVDLSAMTFGAYYYGTPGSVARKMWSIKEFSMANSGKNPCTDNTYDERLSHISAAIAAAALKYDTGPYLRPVLGEFPPPKC